MDPGLAKQPMMTAHIMLSALVLPSTKLLPSTGAFAHSMDVFLQRICNSIKPHGCSTRSIAGPDSQLLVINCQDGTDWVCRGALQHFRVGLAPGQAVSRLCHCKTAVRREHAEESVSRLAAVPRRAVRVLMHKSLFIQPVRVWLCCHVIAQPRRHLGKSIK